MRVFDFRFFFGFIFGRESFTFPFSVYLSAKRDAIFVFVFGRKQKNSNRYIIFVSNFVTVCHKNFGKILV